MQKDKDKWQARCPSGRSCSFEKNSSGFDSQSRFFLLFHIRVKGEFQKILKSFLIFEKSGELQNLCGVTWEDFCHFRQVFVKRVVGERRFHFLSTDVICLAYFMKLRKHWSFQALCVLLNIKKTRK